MRRKTIESTWNLRKCFEIFSGRIVSMCRIRWVLENQKKRMQLIPGTKIFICSSLNFKKILKGFLIIYKEVSKNFTKLSKISQRSQRFQKITKNSQWLNHYLFINNSYYLTNFFYRTLHSLSLADEYIKTALSEKEIPESLKDFREGRLGPKLVRFEISNPLGQYYLSPDRLSVNSQGNFSTIRANTAVFKGKWMFELQLGTKGIMQVGWGTPKSKFNHIAGVGRFPILNLYFILKNFRRGLTTWLLRIYQTSWNISKDLITIAKDYKNIWEI